MDYGDIRKLQVALVARIIMRDIPVGTKKIHSAQNLRNILCGLPLKYSKNLLHSHKRCLISTKMNMMRLTHIVTIILELRRDSQSGKTEKYTLVSLGDTHSDYL